MALNYIKNWPRYEELIQQVTLHENNALAARAPVPHRYEVAPVSERK